MNEDEVQISGWAKNIVNEKWEKYKCWVQRAGTDNSGPNHQGDLSWRKNCN